MKYHLPPNFLYSVAARPLASMYVVVQMRNVVQWHSLPVTGSVWPPVTMYGTPFSCATWLTDSAQADDTAPMIIEQPSFSISLCAFCAARPALALSSSI